ncbi:hypothetical protein [Pandoraea pnomenusa]|uniref:PDC sensor domain-containing protein n=1 Tax=Pandoraea pnomenusa TaxID=93220 RepID=UPI0007BC9F4F|nr:hypothetical protein [Pandoraea pnomenusa]ANC46535.1 hypothetical protein A6P55_22525 [Pandoraea pnomenusa]
MSMQRWRTRIVLQVKSAVRWVSRTPTLIVWSGVGISALVTAVAVALLYEGRLLVLARAADNQRSIAAVLERDLELNFQLYEASLDAVVNLLARRDVDALSPALRRELIFERSRASRYIGSLVVLDPQGNIVIDAESEVPRPYNFADRDYFTVPATTPMRACTSAGSSAHAYARGGRRWCSAAGSAGRTVRSAVWSRWPSTSTTFGNSSIMSRSARKA